MKSSKTLMRDIIVILPGITGSVLEKDGKKIWAPLPQAMLTYLKSLGRSLDWLKLKDDDYECDDLGDGIMATKVVPYTLVPGLSRFDAYTGLKTQLHHKFELIEGNPLISGEAANYFEFPYDWRRDNRCSARKLKEFIERELPKWRNRYPDAQVILLAHSMGGLVARYYLEVLEGYKNTKALITFGTPYFGSIDALNYLANGYTKFSLDFTDLMRTFTSVYQLLPIYSCVLDESDNWRNIIEASIHNIDHKRANEALQFHKEIMDHNEKNRTSDNYDLKILPIVGWGHKTHQSARMKDNCVNVSTEIVPNGVEQFYSGGDGTVPVASAVPKEMYENPNQWWPINQKHACMQNNRDLLQNLLQTLTYFQGRGTPPVRGPGLADVTLGISLETEYIYLPDEPILFKVTTPTNIDSSKVTAIIESINIDGKMFSVRLSQEGNCLEGKIDNLSTGSYRLKIQVSDETMGYRDPIVDVFEVM